MNKVKWQQKLKYSNYWVFLWERGWEDWWEKLFDSKRQRVILFIDQCWSKKEESTMYQWNLLVDQKSTTGKIPFFIIKNSKAEDYPNGKWHLAWMHLIYKYAPRLAPSSSLALKQQNENWRFNSLADDMEVWITQLEVIWYHMDEIRSTSHISVDDFMLHIMGSLPKEYKAVVTNLENRLMTESGKKLPIEFMHQMLNACFNSLSK